jgi:hypothetical protein
VAKTKNSAAVALGKRRAKVLGPERVAEIAGIGGDARAQSLTPERRSEIAKKASAARWKSAKKKADE